ncbi:hypothetical protein [Actinomadura madurae]|uniref:hypothetical protein n=1 Tax=Actinomadura madurae TaxID=1993 RepID=UPI0020D233C7|nr:hypothetical protein [Actinomadura madurae]MCP9976921.1 hypothetical protein [Actinomadura madurae]
MTSGVEVPTTSSPMPAASSPAARSARSAAAAARSEAASPGAATCRRAIPVRRSIQDGSRPSARDSSSLATHSRGRWAPVPRIAHPRPASASCPPGPGRVRPGASGTVMRALPCSQH